jgi:hypothetical protein
MPGLCALRTSFVSSSPVLVVSFLLLFRPSVVDAQRINDYITVRPARVYIPVPLGESVRQNLSLSASGIEPRNYHILFGQVAEVRTFDRTGRQASEFSPSSATDAVIGATGLNWFANDSAIILDKREQRAVVFHFGRAGLRYIRSVSLPVEIDDICVMNGRLYSHSSAGVPTIYSTDMAGGQAKKFVARFDSAPITRLGETLQSAMLRCIPEKRILVVVPLYAARVSAFSDGGKQLWSYDLRNHKRIQVVQNGEVSIQMSTPPAGYHQAISAYQVGRDVLAVQLALVLPRTRRDDRWSVLETRFLLIDSGTELPATEKLPQIVGVGRDFLALADSGLASKIAIHPFSTASRGQLGRAQ